MYNKSELLDDRLKDVGRFCYSSGMPLEECEYLARGYSEDDQSVIIAGYLEAKKVDWVVFSPNGTGGTSLLAMSGGMAAKNMDEILQSAKQTGNGMGTRNYVVGSGELPEGVSAKSHRAYKKSGMKWSSITDDQKKELMSKSKVLKKFKTVSKGGKPATIEESLDNTLLEKNFKNKKELVDFVKTQINIELENDPENRLNKKRGQLYTKIPGTKKTTIMSLLSQYGIRVEQHRGDYYWLWVKSAKKENNTPEFNFAVMLPRDDYHSAINVLNRARIEPKTQFHKAGMAILGFDSEQTGGAGIVEIDAPQIIEILSKAGIAASETDGIAFQDDPETLDVGDENEDSRITEGVEIFRGQLAAKQEKTLQDFEKLMAKGTTADLKLISLFDGIHGVVAVFKSMNPMAMGRMDTKNLKALAGIRGFRWIEFSDRGMMSIGI